MDINYGEILANGLAEAAAMFLKSLAEAFAANPWLFIFVGALLLVSALFPAQRRRRRRRRY